MDRHALFVDAAYLYAAGGLLCCGTKKREELELDFAAAVEELCRVCSGASSLPLLRVYWYDAATNAVPTATHNRVASLHRVQLRLGRLTQGGQKGVDSRIVRDLIVLSRNRALADAFLLSGDDDLREGVSEAQDYGVSVTLIGVEPIEGLQNQAPTLLRAADGTLTLSRAQVSAFLRRVPIDAAELEAGVRAGREFAAGWVQTASAELIRDALATKPQVPGPVFGDLIRFAGARVGLIRDKPMLRRAIIDGFWQVVVDRTVSERPAGT